MTKSCALRVDAFYAFHQANAFEQADGSIVLDIMAYNNCDVTHAFLLENLRGGVRPYDAVTLKR